MMTTDGTDENTANINNPTPNPQPLDQPEQQPQEGVAIDGNGHRDPGAGANPLAGMTPEEIERLKVTNETGNDPGEDVVASPESIQKAADNPKVEDTGDNAFRPEAEHAKEVSEQQRTKLGFPKRSDSTKNKQ